MIILGSSFVQRGFGITIPISFVFIGFLFGILTVIQIPSILSRQNKKEVNRLNWAIVEDIFIIVKSKICIQTVNLVTNKDEIATYM
jgi:hypothetical protein